MFKITFVHEGETTEHILYEPDSKDYAITDCEANFSVKKSGDLKIKLPLTNIARNQIQCLTDEVIFYQNSREKWRGRIVTTEEDFRRNNTLICEGCLSYFCDTWYPPFDFEGSPNELFNDIVLNHNAMVGSGKQINIGNCTVTDPNSYIVRSNEKYMRSIDALNDKLQESTLGGYMRVRVQGGKKYLDYLASYNTTARQKVEFGKNLLDIAKKISYADVVTVLLPTGAKGEDVYDEEGELVQKGEYLTVKDVNGGSEYVVDSNAVNMYGWICDHVEWNDVTIADNLLTKAREYLSKVINPLQTVEVTFVDLAMIDDQASSFELGDEIQVVSSYHNINQTMMLTSMKIYPLRPDKSTLTFGNTKALTDDMKRRQNNLEDAIQQETKDRHSAYENLQKRLDEGEGIFFSEETDSEGGKILYLHNNKELSDSEYVIKINSEAVGFSTDGGETYPYGITIDGDMVMNVIESKGIRAEWVYFTNQETGEKDGTLSQKIAQLIIDNGQITSTVQEVQKIQSGGVGKVETEYYLSTSSSTQTGGSWSTTVPTAAQMKGKFVWTRTKTSYLDTTKTPTYSTPVCITGTDGQAGADGRGISSLQPQYAFHTSNTSAPTENSTSWKDGSPSESEITSSTNANKYIWSRTKITYDNGDIGYTTPTVSAEWEKIKKMSSEISQMADAITMTVKYDGDPSKGGKLRLGSNSAGTGVAFTVDSTNFKVDENGNTTMGGWNVTSNGLYNVKYSDVGSDKNAFEDTVLLSPTGDYSLYMRQRADASKIPTTNVDPSDWIFSIGRKDGVLSITQKTQGKTTHEFKLEYDHLKFSRYVVNSTTLEGEVELNAYGLRPTKDINGTSYVGTRDYQFAKGYFKEMYIDGHSTPVGNVTSGANATAVSLQAQTWASKGGVTPSAGTWLICAHVAFSDIPSTVASADIAVGTMQICISTNAGTSSGELIGSRRVITHAAGYRTGHTLGTMAIFKCTEPTNIYVNAYSRNARTASSMSYSICRIA